jgi:superfamily II DNA/RNA helicase
LALLKELALHKQLQKSLDKLGFTAATTVQQQAIPAALSGKDLLVSAPTGSGKTAAFLLPILQRFLIHPAPNSSTRALVLLPTRELALQTQKTLQQLAAFTPIKCGLIIGGEAFKHQVATLRKNPEVLIATPGRLVEHIEKGTHDFSDLEVMVLDEADRMLDMGFAMDMKTIADSCNKQRQNLLFSATLKHRGLGSISRTFNDPVSIVVGSLGEEHPDICQQLILADDQKHKEQLVLALLAEEQAAKVLIFCKTRRECEQLSNLLRYKQCKARYIHGDLLQNERKQVMNQFRQGALDVLVATDVAARGLDIESVTLVINFSVAQSGDEHLHRIGRTGRAGQQGKAITLIDANEWNQASSIERYLKFRFEHRVINGLKANYTGPKKIKKSGKAAGVKKKKPATKKIKENAVKTPASNPSHAPSTARDKLKRTVLTPVTGNGLDVIRKKKT